MIDLQTQLTEEEQLAGCCHACGLRFVLIARLCPDCRSDAIDVHADMQMLQLHLAEARGRGVAIWNFATMLLDELDAADQLRQWAHEATKREETKLRLLWDRFRLASARLDFVANWLENTHAPGTVDAELARAYANAAKKVLDDGLNALVKGVVNNES